MHDKLLINDKYKIRQCKNGDCYIKSIDTGKFFYKNSFFASEKYHFKKNKILRFEYKDLLFILLISIMIICSIYLIIHYREFIYCKIETLSMLFISILFIIFNVVFHEIGHGLTLKFFGESPGKIKLKFYYIFPVISVETSDIYLLPKFRASCVCIAGIMINIFLCTLVITLLPNYNYVITPVISLIIFSLIPFSGVKTDGYNLFVTTLMNINEFKGKRNKVSVFFEIVLNITLVLVMAHYLYSLFII